MYTRHARRPCKLTIKIRLTIAIFIIHNIHARNNHGFFFLKLNKILTYILDGTLRVATAAFAGFHWILKMD